MFCFVIMYVGAGAIVVIPPSKERASMAILLLCNNASPIDAMLFVKERGKEL